MILSQTISRRLLPRPTHNFHLVEFNANPIARSLHHTSISSAIKMSKSASDPASSFCPPSTSSNDTFYSPSHKRQKMSDSEPSTLNASKVKGEELKAKIDGKRNNVYKKKSNQKQKDTPANPTFPLEQPEGFALDCPSLPERLSRTDLNYENTLTLAPMVRIGSLPTRLLSLEYGADLVWGPEVIDRAIIPTERSVDPTTGLIEWIKDGKQIFSTHPIERPRVIFQLGSASPELASQAVKKVCETDSSRPSTPDVAAVCLNCGCPKHFSTHGGMGANLLYTPKLLCSILIEMREAAPPSVSVHAKIRLLPSQKDTLALVRAIVRTNAVDCITVHCRTKDMRPREPALPERMREVRDEIYKVGEGRVKVGCNGDAWDADEASKIKALTGVDSVMIARGAEANPSVFTPLSQGGPVSVPDVIIPKWIRYHIIFNNPMSNTKYCVSALSYSNQPFHFTSGPPVQARIEAKKAIRVPQLSSNSDAKKWTKDKLKALRESIIRSRTTEDIVEAVGLKDQLKAQEERDWKATLQSLGEVMKAKCNWDWIKETENVIEAEQRTRRESNTVIVDGTEQSRAKPNEAQAEEKVEEVAHEANPPLVQ